MDQMTRIQSVQAREILDSRGFPTVEVEMVVADAKKTGGTSTVRAMVPSGASTGEGEALELRDGDQKRYLGKGVQKAVNNVREKIAPVIQQREFAKQMLLDDLLKELDGTENKSHLGANAMLAVSMAFARAQARSRGLSLHASIAEIMGTKGVTLPVPLMNVLNGGKHADNGLAIQEFMIVPAGFTHFKDALRAGTEVFHYLKRILHKKGLSTAVGDEGGFAPAFSGEKPHEQALVALMQAISDAGYKAGKEIYLALDCASSEFSEKGRTESDGMIYHFEGQKLTHEHMVGVYQKWVKEFPIISIEDGLSEHDWAGWSYMTQKIGAQCQLVGDDLFVTNPIYLQKGIDRKTANAILIKLNQIGTVTETLETIRMAQQSGYASISSHRSGETEDTFIADMAVGTDCGQIKTGSASRTDRIAKYNQLLRIEEKLGKEAHFAGFSAFRALKS